MQSVILHEIETLRTMTVPELRDQYARVFGETTASRHKQFLVKRIAWGMQARATGGLSERARKRADELANDSELRILAPKEWTETRSFQPRNDGPQLIPGSEIVRDYKGTRVVVKVLSQGYEWNGTVYKSLSAVAKAITGQHWNGPLFFRLPRKGRTA